jgi:poly-gamma-glutamate synthesis protein (capsule biosynthesis protein)
MRPKKPASETSQGIQLLRIKRFTWQYVPSQAQACRTLVFVAEWIGVESVLRRTAKIFLCGDVMPGRGIDQILPYPCDPVLHERYAKSARDYVRLAERANGPIPSEADFSYIWGAALHEFDRAQPDLRIVNLETSITSRGVAVPKGINYRMSPENAATLLSADIDCCVLANNHVLDWGEIGLLDTLESLERFKIGFAGAGRNLDEASKPAILHLEGGRVPVFAFCSKSSGVPGSWAAKEKTSGVNLLENASAAAAGQIARQVHSQRQPGDAVIVSIHWGPNWGYDIPKAHRRFAHALIDAGVSVVHGHSSHHPLALELYRGRLILYGCGDFLNDYEGISGYEEFLPNLALMYFVEIDLASGHVIGVEMAPLRISRFRLERTSSDDRQRLFTILHRESQKFGCNIALQPNGYFALS